MARRRKRKASGSVGPIRVRAHTRSPRGPNRGKPVVTVHAHRRHKPHHINE